MVEIANFMLYLFYLNKKILNTTFLVNTQA